jgi:hypothetical protein
MVELTRFDLVFSLSVPQARSVTLIVNSSDFKPMAPDAPGVWSASIPIVAPSYPFALSYNYARDGIQCFESDRAVEVCCAPLAPVIAIRDSYPPAAPLSPGIRVYFHVHSRRRADERVLLVFPLSAAQRPLRLHRRDANLWVAPVTVAGPAAAPLAYKYAVTTAKHPEIAREEAGRPHLLRLNFCARAIVAVFDLWCDAADGFPYFCRAIQPTASRAHAPLFALEYLAPECEASVFVSGSAPAIGAGQAAAAEPMVRQGAWRFEKPIAADQFPFTFKFGVLKTKDSKKMHDVALPDFQIVLPEFIIPSVVAARMIVGAKRKHFAVYAPLVSLCSHENSEVGDFATIVDLADWARSCGIGQLHLHIETLAGYILDPIHAAVEYVHPGYDIAAVRKSKLIALYNLFSRSSHETDPFFRQHPWIEPLCTSPFERWLQLFLFSQLEVATTRVIELGVQLVTDFVVTGPLMDNTGPLSTFARLFHGIRLVGLANYLRPPSIAFIEGLFDDHVPFVLENCFTVQDGAVTFRPGVQIDAVLATVESTAIREDLRRRLAFAQSLPPANEAQCREFLMGLSPNLPCALVIDEAASAILGGRAVVSKLKMIPSGSGPMASTWLGPSFLSPEMISEFPQGEGRVAMRDAIKARMKTDALSATVYLNDLRTVFRDEQDNVVVPLSLQRIQGHCRFAAPFTLMDLTRDTALNEQIRNCMRLHDRHA